MPASVALFALWIDNFKTRVTATPATYGLTAADAIIISGISNTFLTAHALANAPATRTPVSIADRDAARAAAEFVVRPYAVAISLDKAVDNGAKVEIGVTVRSNTPTPIPAPVVAPTLELLGILPLRMDFQARQPGMTSKSKPGGCTGIELALSVGTVAATDPGQLTMVNIYGKTPFTVPFVAADRGKIASIAARYRTRSGPAGVSQAGPWSDIVSYHVA